ncbi:HEAT repeat domain-containing protein [Candidatus Pacearchaeota archaeon]|nr:HEAT repeat domain-containing protein [Candidatus Pacearchaeota archaeon]
MKSSSIDNVSVVVRFKDEEKTLRQVLSAVRAQKYDGKIQIIGIDNQSTDGSRIIAEKFADEILDIYSYEPGKALNLGIENSNGEIIVVLSGHTIPCDRNWLTNLTAPLRTSTDRHRILGVYGGQHYPCTARFLDKRDLDMFGFTEARIEYRDSDFWNANSAFRKASWEIERFSERVYELEDHYWTKRLLNGDSFVRFEPEAYVYHYEHKQRVDRQYPNLVAAKYEAAHTRARKLLDNSNAWEDVMWSALILNTLPTELITAEDVQRLSCQLRSHEDFDVRWRIAQTLGNIPLEASIPVLLDTLSDRSFYARNEAAWSLRKLLSISSNQLLARFDELTGDAKLHGALALGGASSGVTRSTSINHLEKTLICGEGENCRNALYVIGELEAGGLSDSLIDACIEAIKCEDSKVQATAFWALGRISEYSDIGGAEENMVFACTENTSIYARTEATFSLMRYIRANGNEDLLPILYLVAAEDSDARVRYAGTQSIRQLAKKYQPFEWRQKVGDEAYFGIAYERELLNMDRNSVKSNEII